MSTDETVLGGEHKVDAILAWVAGDDDRRASALAAELARPASEQRSTLVAALQPPTVPPDAAADTEPDAAIGPSRLYGAELPEMPTAAEQNVGPDRLYVD